MEGRTYGCYHVGTTDFTPGSTGINLTVFAESDIDGDTQQRLRVPVQAHVRHGGDPDGGAGQRRLHGRGATFPDGANPPYGQPVNVGASGDNIF